MKSIKDAAVALLSAYEREINVKQKELRKLEAQSRTLRSTFKVQRAISTPKPKKVDWDGVFAKMPTRFTMIDLKRALPGTKHQAIGCAVGRWCRYRDIKKTPKGYVKL